MNIKVIAVGKLKEKYWINAIKEYSKRLNSYCNLEFIEIKETLLKKENQSEEEKVKASEGDDILKKIKGNEYVISLEIKGNMLSSEDLAKKIDMLGIEGKSNITFVIGGSLGLSEEVSKRADFSLSFSEMTFPHQMMRVILLEQVYRAFKINRNETYHK